HNVNVGTAIADVDNMIGGNSKMCFELIEPLNFSVTGRGSDQTFNLARIGVLELRAEGVILGHDPLQRRLDHLDRRRREHVKIKMEPVNPPVQYLVNLIDVLLEANTLAGLDQVVATDPRMEFRIV